MDGALLRDVGHHHPDLVHVTREHDPELGVGIEHTGNVAVHVSGDLLSDVGQLPSDEFLGLLLKATGTGGLDQLLEEVK